MIRVALRRLLALVFLFGFLASAGAPALAQTGPQPRLPTAPLTVITAKGAFHFTVEMAANDRSRETGLMFRKRLAPNAGMLFDFGSPRPVAFWMKNTLIPLDMLFIAADGRIVSIARNAPPLSEAPIWSGGDILGVLEIAGGRAEAIGAEPGDRVRNRIFGR